MNTDGNYQWEYEGFNLFFSWNTSFLIILKTNIASRTIYYPRGIVSQKLVEGIHMRRDISNL